MWAGCVALAWGNLARAEVAEEADSSVDAPAQQPLLQVYPGGLTRGVVVRRALDAAPSVRVRAAERAAAEARVDQAIAAFLPRLKLSATYRRVAPVEVSLSDAAIVGAKNPGPLFVGPSPAAGMSNLIVDSKGQPIGAQAFIVHSIENQYELKAELGIPVSDLLFRMKRTVGAAKSGTEAARLLESAERQKVALDASLAYYNFLRAESSVQVSKRSLERTRSLLEDTKATTRAGLSTKADALRVDALLASTEVAVAEAERMQALTKRQLQVMLDDDRLVPQAGEEISFDSAPGIPISMDEATRRALANRPELRALHEAQSATAQRSSSLRVGRYPRLDAFGLAIQGRPNSSVFIPQDEWRVTWAVGATVSYSPNDTIAGGASVAEAEAEHRRLAAELEAADRSIRLQTAAAALDLSKVQTQLGAAVRGQQAARDAYLAAHKLYKAGEATTTDVLDAETRLLTAELQLVYARLDWMTATVRIAHATGDDLTRETGASR